MVAGTSGNNPSIGCSLVSNTWAGKIQTAESWDLQESLGHLSLCLWFLWHGGFRVARRLTGQLRTAKSYVRESSGSCITFYDLAPDVTLTSDALYSLEASQWVQTLFKGEELASTSVGDSVEEFVGILVFSKLRHILISPPFPFRRFSPKIITWGRTKRAPT